MILSGAEILSKVEGGEVFIPDTWDHRCFKEASYALRVASDGLVVEGEHYPPHRHIKGPYIEIKPGKIAILSTKEKLCMPNDLVGKIGIRLQYALQGLTGLMGIQVDPGYGHGRTDERLYIRVANLGNESIRLLPGDDVFTFELHTTSGITSPDEFPKEPTWERLQKALANQDEVSWSYMSRVESNLERETQLSRESMGPVVLFGVFLVAVTILGVVIAIILNVSQEGTYPVPEWVTDWAWKVLFVTLCFAAFATGIVGISAAIYFARDFFGTGSLRRALRRTFRRLFGARHASR